MREEYVYDLEVEDGHTFLANGIFVHNTTATAWLLREELSKKFPLLAAYLRPACDYAGRCLYHRPYTLSEAFGCLFKECGRNPCKDSNDYAIWNEACSDKATLEKQLGIKIPEPGDWKKIEEEALKKDMKYFEMD